jgi:hypothetical protein
MPDPRPPAFDREDTGSFRRQPTSDSGINSIDGVVVPTKTIVSVLLALAIGLAGGGGGFAMLREARPAIPVEVMADIKATKDATEKTTNTVDALTRQVIIAIGRLDTTAEAVKDHETRLRVLEAKSSRGGSSHRAPGD